MSFLAYRFLPFFLAVMAIVPTMGLSLALAFYRVNNRPFIHAVESAVKYFFQSKLYIWKKEYREKDSDSKGDEVGKGPAVSGLPIPKLSDSKLKEISWSLDINDSLYASYDKEHKTSPRN